ncbi:MAG: heme-binding protein [Chloroflexota bacterium]
MPTGEKAHTGCPGGVAWVHALPWHCPHYLLQGGVVIQRPSDEAFLGAIGVSGLRAEEDEAIARIGVQAMGL